MGTEANVAYIAVVVIGQHVALEQCAENQEEKARSSNPEDSRNKWLVQDH
jgi:hypothetical protein